MISKEIAEKIRPGARVVVWEKFKEGDKERTIKFEGLVLARKHGNEIGAMFTVRGTVADIGLEKVFPIHSPAIEKVQIVSSPKKVHKSKLYYVRDLSRRQIRQRVEG